MFISGLIIGLLIGTSMGVIIMSLMASSSRIEAESKVIDKNYITEISEEITPNIDKKDM